MSVKVMALCYDVCFLSSCRKAVAVAIADHVDDRGEHAFPSIARLADKTEFSERAVQYAIRDMEAVGLLVITDKGGAGAKDTREWRFDMEMLRGLADGYLEIVENDGGDAPEKGATGAPMSRVRVQPVPGRVQPTTNKGAPGAPEPSLTVINHPGASARATPDGRASPALPASRKLVLPGDDQWDAWIFFADTHYPPGFSDALIAEGAMLIYADKPSHGIQRPTLPPLPGTAPRLKLEAEREERLAKTVKGLTAKSKAMTGEAA